VGGVRVRWAESEICVTDGWAELERYVTTMWSDKFTVRAEHDGTFINCSVVVSRFPVPVASQSAMLTVRCKQSHSLC